MSRDVRCHVTGKSNPELVVICRDIIGCFVITRGVKKLFLNIAN